MDLIGEKPNPFKGECYVASALVYTIFDGKGLTLYRKKDFENKFHWWIKTNEGVTIDITADQYLIQGQDVPSSSYENAEASKPMWFPSYKKRVAKMMDELALYINENRIQLEC